MKLKNLVFLLIIFSCKNSLDVNTSTDAYLNSINELYDNGEYLSCATEIIDILENEDLPIKKQNDLKYIKAKCLFNLEYYFKCIEEIDGIIDYYYEDTLLYELRGDSYNNLGHHDLALRDYKNILKINPKSARAYNRVGLLHYKRFELNKAERYIDSALKYEPRKFEAITNKGIILGTKRLFKEGLKYEERGYKIRNTAFGAYSLGIAYKNIRIIDTACYYWKIALDSNYKPAEEYYKKYCSN